MKHYEKEIRRRLFIKTVFCVSGAIALLTTIIIKLCHGDTTQGISGFSISMLVGMLGGILVSTIPSILRYRKALKDKEALENLHINENDELNQMIEYKTCRSSLLIALTLLGYAALVAALFSKIIFITLGFTLIVICAIYVIIKIIYKRNSYK